MPITTSVTKPVHKPVSAPRLLSLNLGSSSIKLGVFEWRDGHAHRVGHGALDLSQPSPQLQMTLGGSVQRWPLDVPVDDTLQPVLGAVLDVLASEGALDGLSGAGHRVVHGGDRYTAAVRLDAAVLSDLDALVPLAPLHQPHNLKLIRALTAVRPGLPQTASFDTAFHAGQADFVRRYALPRQLHDSGIRRYGFHGLSYRYIARALKQRAPHVAAGRVVVAHLGSGVSLCALHEGRSVETTMGFSVLDGAPMATRCGALDPGVLLYLMQQRGMDVAAVQELLYHRSGLLGLSGRSGDVRVLRASGDAAAQEALAIFALRTAGEVARLATTMGGLDAVVFTAGIGEHDAATRAAICEHLAWLGLGLDDRANRAHAERIDAAGTRIACFVIATDEEQVIADDAFSLLTGPLDLNQAVDAVKAR